MAKLVIGNDKTVGVPVIMKEIEKLPALGLMKAKDANGKLINSTTESQMIDFTGVTDIGDYVLHNAYYNNTAISGAVDMSDLIAISGINACNGMFLGCTGLTSVVLSSLTTISGGNACSYIFSGCTGITSVDLSSLTTITGNQACSGMFQNCTSLATVRIGNTTAIDFGTRTNQFINMFSGCSQNIDVYAPAGNQAEIEAKSGYPNFGATGTVTWHWNTAE